MDATVCVHSINHLHCGHVEEHVHQNGARDRREEDGNAQPADGLLVLDDEQLLRLLRVEEEVRKDGRAGHAGGGTPGECRVPAVLAAVGDAQEHIARA